MTVSTPSYSFSRPADTTAYTAGDLVANSTTAGSVVPMSWSLKGVSGTGTIRAVRLYKSSTTATAATFIVHLFSGSPTVTNGDNGALAVATAATYLGEVSVDMSSGASPGTDYLFKSSAAVAIGVQMTAINDKIYGLLEATAGYAPASGETFVVVLDIEGERR